MLFALCFWGSRNKSVLEAWSLLWSQLYVQCSSLVHNDHTWCKFKFHIETSRSWFEKYTASKICVRWWQRYTHHVLSWWNAWKHSTFVYRPKQFYRFCFKHNTGAAEYTTAEPIRKGLTVMKALLWSHAAANFSKPAAEHLSLLRFPVFLLESFSLKVLYSLRYICPHSLTGDF